MQVGSLLLKKKDEFAFYCSGAEVVFLQKDSRQRWVWGNFSHTEESADSDVAVRERGTKIKYLSLHFVT